MRLNFDAAALKKRGRVEGHEVGSCWKSPEQERMVMERLKKAGVEPEPGASVQQKWDLLVGVLLSGL